MKGFLFLNIQSDTAKIYLFPGKLTRLSLILNHSTLITVHIYIYIYVCILGNTEHKDNQGMQ